MELELAGRTAYVTGAARGIGRAIADLLAAEGARVAGSDVDAAELGAAAAGWGEEAVAIEADLATEEATRAAERAMHALGGPPDILVNNVGAAGSRPFAEMTDADWRAGFELNFLSHVRTTRALIAAMAERRGGSIVFVASDLAKQPEAMPVDYAAFKTGLLALVKALSLAYAPAVRVNAVCPGPILTDLWTKPGGVVDDLARLYGLPPDEALRRHVDERHLPRGIGEPADVAAAVAFLVSPRAKHIDATALSIDGGSVRGLL